MKSIAVKSILMTGAVLALMAAPAAFAQSATSETTISRSVTPSGDDSVNVKRTEKSVDSDGTQVERSKSYSSQPGDSNVRVKRTEKVTDTTGGEVEKSRTYSNDGVQKKVTTQTRTKTPDGAEETTQTERKTTP